MRPRGPFLLGLACLAASVSCAPLNARLPPSRYPTAGGDGPGYRFQGLKAGENSDRLFVCLTFSGGGTRAAAFAYGAMIALKQATIALDGRTTSVLDEADCISSVSGGSFTAAYYGLFRDRIFDDFERRVLSRNIQGLLVLSAFNPLNWPRLASPYFSRIDLAAELYDREIFDHKSYADLIKDARRPFIILNATNLGRGIRFPFTQDQFDLIGSDLGPYAVARGVAASSAFPFLLSPLTLKSYQPLEGFTPPTAYELGALPESYNVSRSRYYWSKSQLDYVRRPHPYLHLMDGGLTDNIGLRSVLNAYEQSTGFIHQRWPEMKRFAVIAVNARTQSKDAIDDAQRTPHIVPTVALATATTSMDNYSFDTVDLADRLTTELRQARLVSRQTPGQPPLRVPIPYVVEISFEAIKEPAVRDAFFAISTSFHLPHDQVQALISRGCELIKADPVFRCLLEDLERDAAGGKDDASACEKGLVPLHPHAVDRIVCPAPGPWPRVDASAD